MNYVEIPNLPEGPVLLVVVDGRISGKIEQKFRELGVKLIKTHAYPGVYEAISYHPDIMIHHIGGDAIVYAPGTHPELLNLLSDSGFRLIQGSCVPGPSYPENIPYNAARVGNFAFHNLKYMDPVLKRELDRQGVELVHVNQGYAKCSISVISSNCIITADRGIARTAEAKGVEVLVIEQEEAIVLPGVSSGFIGGSTGLIDKNRWLITGSLERLKSADKIFSFLSQKGFEIVQASDEQVIDVGSVIPLLTK